MTLEMVSAATAGAATAATAPVETTILLACDGLARR